MMRDVDTLTRRFGPRITQHINTSKILEIVDVINHPQAYMSRRPLQKDATKLNL